ncbi:MAG: biotin--[acetyl-CoA-carboxylase] ligase [Alphaproteobacteria bacterium]|nr:biotin--[acetyl-CoA-carboxylase] ligase [Alphaproteobacteria bacterium]
MTPGAPVYWYDEIDSTSAEVRRRARLGELGPLWIAARSQSAGRGRLGRSWSSPPGNLFTTALLTEPGGLSAAARIPFAAGLSVHDACKSVLPDVDFRLKWPNDVRVDGAKMCGILVESGETNGVTWIAVGIGLNVQTAPHADQPTCSLHTLGAPLALSAEHMLEALRPAFCKRLAQARDGFPGLLNAWQGVAEGLGQTVRAGPPDARLEGVFEGLAEDGGLIMRLPNGAMHTIRAGDVDLVRRID